MVLDKLLNSLCLSFLICKVGIIMTLNHRVSGKVNRTVHENYVAPCRLKNKKGFELLSKTDLLNNLNSERNKQEVA